MALAATLAAPFLLYLVARAAFVSLAPAAAAALPPKDHSILGRGLLYTTADPRRRVTEDMREEARRVALSAPLAYEPFFIEAKAQEQSGNLDRAIRILEEGRRRRPSFVLPRIQLLAYYQQARRFPELLREIDFVLRKSPEAQRFILPELAKLMADRQGRAALATILARGPEWRDAFFRVARGQEGRPEEAQALLDQVRARNPRMDLTLERGLYLHRLVQAGEYGPARRTWLEDLPPRAREANRLLFNGAFQAMPADPPFGWTFRDEAAGRANIVSAGTSTPYLEIVYFGGSDFVLAEQTLALVPGTYRLMQVAKSDQGIRSGEIYWSLTCIESAREVARLPLRDLRPAYRPSHTEFTVPAGCDGQRLLLMARPGDIAAEVEVQLARLELTRAQ